MDSHQSYKTKAAMHKHYFLCLSAGGRQRRVAVPRESLRSPTERRNLHNNEGSKAKIVAADGSDQRGAVSGGPGGEGGGEGEGR